MVCGSCIVVRGWRIEKREITTEYWDKLVFIGGYLFSESGQASVCVLL